jgi:hypothetical protein
MKLPEADMIAREEGVFVLLTANEVKALESGKRVFFCMGKPGAYSVIILTTSDEEANVEPGNCFVGNIHIKKKEIKGLKKKKSDKFLRYDADEESPTIWVGRAEWVNYNGQKPEEVPGYA